MSFAQKQPVEMSEGCFTLLYFDYISEPVPFHFDESKEVESKVNKYLCFNLRIIGVPPHCLVFLVSLFK